VPIIGPAQQTSLVRRLLWRDTRKSDFATGAVYVIDGGESSRL